MSSILDALKKLEEEKAKRAKEGGAKPPMDPMTPVPEYHPRTAAPHAPALSPRTLMLGIGIMSVALIAVSVSVSVVLLRNTAPANVAHNAPAAPVAPPAAPKEEAVPVESATEPVAEPANTTPPPDAVVPEPVTQPPPPLAPVAAKPVQEEAPAPSPKPEAPAPAKPAPVPAPAPEPVKVAAAPVPLPKPEPEPAPAPAPAPEPEPVAVAPEPAPAPAPNEEPMTLRAKDVAPVEDLRSLPELRSTERMRFGLEGMRINFLRESAPQRPAAMAVINLNKIHIGEVIPGTKARLIAVERHGIGIEIATTGDRFYVPL